jgi:hypothetical protein
MNRLTPPLGVVALVVLALLLAACGRAPVAPAAQPTTPAAAGLSAVVLRSPTCSCCHEHEEYLRAGGIETHSVVDPDVTRVKEAYGVPREMYSCHTTDIGGYFVEGHVPLEAIHALLAGQPDLDGISLPGMPAGSPGMGGVKDGPLTVYGIRDGKVVDVFGTY